MNLRELIDDAKARAASLDAVEIVVDSPDGEVKAERRKPTEHKEKDPIDPSNVAVAADPELAATLIAQLTELRASARVLADRDAAIKAVLQDMVGELEYLSLDDSKEPVISVKHESSVRLVTARVREQFPPSEYPDLYSQSNSRPLRLMA